MRAVIQRVKRASVAYEGAVREIGAGLVVLLGVRRGDSEKDAEWLSSKILNLRVFPDAAGRFDKSVTDVKGELLVVSQFTLYGECSRGRRPDFGDAEPPSSAEAMYEKFVGAISSGGLRVETGKFAAEMLVEIINDGPVTLIVDSKERK